jgi:hypothetical protein
MEIPTAVLLSLAPVLCGIVVICTAVYTCDCIHFRTHTGRHMQKGIFWFPFLGVLAAYDLGGLGFTDAVTFSLVCGFFAGLYEYYRTK